VPGGLVSNWMCDNLKLGDELDVRGPAGKFSCFNYPSQKMLFIGAGSGITPVMSMLRWIVDTVADVDVLMLVSARSPQDVIFRKELEWITSRHSGIRVVVTVTGKWTGVESWTGLTGRCDARMLKWLVPDLNDRHVFMCGPGVFMDAVKDALRQIEYPLAQLHSESFGEARVVKGEDVKPRDVPKPGAPMLRTPDPVPAQSVSLSGVAPSIAATPVGAMPIAALSVAAPMAPVAPAAPSASEVAAPAFQVRFSKAGKLVATGGESNVLDLAEANGIEIDYACRAGSCGSCKVLCKKGTCEMDENELSDGEKKQGFIYACVARPTSDVEIEA
jgi:ferredoxin-NADP reductase/ferredoxin